MAKRIIYIVIAVVLLASLWYWYNNRSETLALDSGGVTSHDTLGSNSKSAMDSGVVTGSDLDGKPAGSDGYGGSVSYTNNPPTGPKAATGTQAYSGAVSPGSASPQAVAQAQQAMPVQTPASSTTPASLPVSDTLSPNSPNGMAFGGSGKFQWYRQGNLTWRINTQSGATCVAFATMDEWQKEIVYSHGCGNA